jgi:hypothetical protein
MRRTIIGTRFTTGCGHSWKRRFPRWTRRDLTNASADCIACGKLLLIARGQFEGKDPNAFPAEVHMPLFHKQLSEETDGMWPADGENTYYAEFNADQET